jgi:iron(III) transport system permease protein
MDGRRGWHLWIGIAAAGFVILPPVVWLAIRLARVQGGVPQFDNVAMNLFARSLAVAFGAAGLALALGAPVGLFLARWGMPGRAVLRLLLSWPLFLPPYVGALAWNLILSREGWLNQTLLRAHLIDAPLSPVRCPAAVCFVLASTYWPVVGVLIANAARSIPRELEDAAWLEADPVRASLWSMGPGLARAGLAGTLLVFILGLADFGAPNSLSLPTYPVEIVNRFQLDRDPGGTIVLAAPLLVVVLPLIGLLHWALGRAEPLPASRTALRDLPAGRGAWVLSMGCLAVLTATLFAPLAQLAVRSLPLRTYRAVWEESSGHLANTVSTVGAATGAILVLALAAGWGGGRKMPGLLSAALTIPAAIPASLTAVAMIDMLNRDGPLGLLYTTEWGLVWTYVVLFYPFAHHVLAPAWNRVDPAQLDEGRILGASGWAMFRDAVWPVVRGPALIGGIVVAVLAAREIDATALIRIPGGDTVAFRIYDYLHFEPGPNVAALSLLLFTLSAAAVSGLQWWAARLDD